MVKIYDVKQKNRQSPCRPAGRREEKRWPMSRFQEVIGHKRIIQYIGDAVRAGAVSHAYIISGEKGSGKHLLADIFSACLQCEQPGEDGDSCGKCHSCRQLQGGNQPDVITVFHEKPAVISIDEIRRQVNQTVSIKPYSSKYKIYIVPDADMMTEQAQNSLLKTIEEPPEYVVIFLLSENPDKLLPTIRSRCVMMQLRNVKDDLIYKYLTEQIHIPDYRAKVCVAFARGNMGRAIMLSRSEHFQVIRDSAVNLVKKIRDISLPDFMDALSAVEEMKIDIGDYLDVLSIWYRDVLIYKATKNVDRVVFSEQIKSIKEAASLSSYEGIEKIIKALDTAGTRLKANVNYSLTMELLLLVMKEN